MKLDTLLIPLIISGILLYGLYKEVDVFQVFVEGAREGIAAAINILPALVALMTCVGIFKASGALDILTHTLGAAAARVGLPGEVIPLAILRPISGSGGLAIYNKLLESVGPDSYVGRIASVMMGSSETTFYTIAVYFGAVNIGKSRHALPASLITDLTGFLMSAITVRLFFGRV